MILCETGTDKKARVGIGTIYPRALLHVAGNVKKPGGGTWTSESDLRLKKNVKTLKGALDKLLKLRGVNFERINTLEKKLKKGE